MWRRVLKGARNIVQNFKDPMRFQSETTLFDFSKVEDFKALSAFSDATFGGCSTASLTHNPHVAPKTTTETGFVTFSGSCTTEIAEGSRIKRSGFCGLRSNSDGDYIDVSEFDQLVLKIRGTQQTFLANIRIYNFITGSESQDVWQAFFSCRGDRWHDVQIPLHSFVLTWKGKVVPEVTEMNCARIMSFGITMSLPSTAKGNLDFYLDIASIKATAGNLE